MQVDVDGGGVELLSGGVRGVRVRGEGWSTPTGRKGSPPGQCPSSAPLPPPGRAWRLWAARHSEEEAGPLGAQPLPRSCSRSPLLALAAPKAADPATAFAHVGTPQQLCCRSLDVSVGRASVDLAGL